MDFPQPWAPTYYAPFCLPEKVRLTHSDLTETIRACTICEEHLPLGPRPVFHLHPEARIALISQAPGRVVHENGVPWRDQSGERLRTWLGVDDALFYDSHLFAILPMGFCYPGRGKSGDLPPRPECAPAWHETALRFMPQLRLKVLIGAHAQKYYLGKKARRNLTETVRHYKDYLPHYFPIPHPSPLNTGWLRQRPWVEEEVMPELRARIRQAG